MNTPTLLQPFRSPEREFDRTGKRSVPLTNERRRQRRRQFRAAVGMYKALFHKSSTRA